MQHLSEATMRHAIRRLFATYLFISGIALAFPHRPDTWLPLAILHLFGIIILLQIGPYPLLLGWLTRQWPWGVRVLGDWYGLALIPALYTELAVLNVAVFNGRYFDSLLLTWEQALFGGQPSRDLAQTMQFLPLSELLHFSYLSYYLIIYGPPLYLYLRGRRSAHQQLVFTLILTFFAHYIFFIYFPVQGPRYIFPAPGGDISRGFFYNLAHRILEGGSSRGAAFPSSHVGVSFAQAALAFSLLPRVAPIILLLSLGLAVGAVYGGFHYAIDVLCGLAFGLLLFAIAPRVARWFGASPR
jgi:membrane-associated phospholipid phosphatase